MTPRVLYSDSTIGSTVPSMPLNSRVKYFSLFSLFDISIEKQVWTTTLFIIDRQERSRRLLSSTMVTMSKVSHPGKYTTISRGGHHKIFRGPSFNPQGVGGGWSFWRRQNINFNPAFLNTPPTPLLEIEWWPPYRGGHCTDHIVVWRAN